MTGRHDHDQKVRMIRLSIQARQALARLTLPVLIVVVVRLHAARQGRHAAGGAGADGARGRAGADLRRAGDAARRSCTRRHRNRRRCGTCARKTPGCARKTRQLRRWQSIALALDAENQRLKASLRWIPDPDASFVTARVVADAGGVYAKAVLLSVGPNHGIRKGEIAVDERGLIGRITEVGARTARVLLITDLNSRIPVILETSRAHAILVGTNGPRPRLLYWPEGVVPQEGERIVTSAEANAFPANLPVGTVHYTGSGAPEVEPAAMLQKLEVVRIFDYGLTGVPTPEAGQPRPTRLAATDGAVIDRASRHPAAGPASAGASISPRGSAFPPASPSC